MKAAVIAIGLEIAVFIAGDFFPMHHVSDFVSSHILWVGLTSREIKSQLAHWKNNKKKGLFPYVTDLERLEKLFSLTMIAFVWCYKIGDYLDENINKTKKNNKTIWQKSCKCV